MNLHRFTTELYIFTLKQANAALFGGLLLGAILISSYVDLPFLHRYDYIFIFAVVIQLLLITFGFEHRREVVAIFVFHIVATIMEFFKTADAIGSWQYPEDAFFKIAGVPLFAGFMYSAVGSYIARAWKLHTFRFTNYPHQVYTYVLAVSIYINFFTHHFIYDFRYVLIAATFFLFFRTRIYFTVGSERSMPLLLGFILVSFFIWIAENVSTFAGVWLYPNQTLGWTLVSPHKIAAWFLLMIISFVLVSVLYRRGLR